MGCMFSERALEGARRLLDGVLCRNIRLGVFGGLPGPSRREFQDLGFR